MAQADELGKVLNATATMRMKIQMAFQHIQCTLLLHQGQAIDKAEVDLTSHRDWGSMTSSPCLKMLWNSPRNPIGEMITEESRKELLGAMRAKGEVDMGDTVVYPISNIKENRQVVAAWNGEVKRFEQSTRLECPRWEDVPKTRGAKGYLGIWVDGLSPRQGEWADSLSEEISAKAESGLEWGEPQNPDSQGTSSGYAKETLGHRRRSSAQHEVESPISCAFRTKHLAAPGSMASNVEDFGTSDFVTGSYHPQSSIQMMKDEMTLRLPELPLPAFPPKYAPIYGTEDPLSLSDKLCSNKDYFKCLSLVLSFEPLMAYSMTETVPTRSAQTLEMTLRGQPSTPRQLGIYNPTNPTFSDMLRKGEMRPPAPGCPLPPHMPNIPGNGPPDPPSPSS